MGYFFVHSTAEPLQALAGHLQAQGYTFVELFEQEPEEGDAPFHVLHVGAWRSTTKRRWIAATRNSQRWPGKGVEDYDGMDVGPAPALQ